MNTLRKILIGLNLSLIVLCGSLLVRGFSNPGLTHENSYREVASDVTKCLQKAERQMEHLSLKTTSVIEPQASSAVMGQARVNQVHRLESAFLDKQGLKPLIFVQAHHPTRRSAPPAVFLPQPIRIAMG